MQHVTLNLHLTQNTTLQTSKKKKNAHEGVKNDDAVLLGGLSARVIHVFDLVPVTYVFALNHFRVWPCESHKGIFLLRKKRKSSILKHCLLIYVKLWKAVHKIIIIVKISTELFLQRLEVKSTFLDSSHHHSGFFHQSVALAEEHSSQSECWIFLILSNRSIGHSKSVTLYQLVQYSFAS